MSERAVAAKAIADALNKLRDSGFVLVPMAEYRAMREATVALQPFADLASTFDHATEMMLDHSVCGVTIRQLRVARFAWRAAVPAPKEERP